MTDQGNGVPVGAVGKPVDGAAGREPAVEPEGRLSGIGASGGFAGLGETAAGGVARGIASGRAGGEGSLVGPFVEGSGSGGMTGGMGRCGLGGTGVAAFPLWAGAEGTSGSAADNMGDPASTKNPIVQ